MTLDERLVYLATVQQSHDDQIAKLAEQNHETGQLLKAASLRMDVLTERSIQMMESINRLARIAEYHDHRLDDLEDQRPS